MTMQSSRVRPELAAPSPEAVSRDLCHAHAGALLGVALLILDDPRPAVDIVAEVIAAAVRAGVTGDVAGTVMRQRLARSVFHRSRGRLVARERFGDAPVARGRPEPGELPVRLRGLDAQLRAVVALVVFGQHGLGSVSAALSLPPGTTVDHMRHALGVLRAT